jgi:hypothetical protein
MVVGGMILKQEVLHPWIQMLLGVEGAAIKAAARGAAKKEQGRRLHQQEQGSGRVVKQAASMWHGEWSSIEQM